MSSKFMIALTWIVAIAILVMHNQTIHAYVLQGPHILDLTVKNIGQAESLLVSQKVIIFPVEADAESENPAAGEDQPAPVDAGAADGFSQAGYPGLEESPSVQEVRELEGTLRYVFSKAFRSDTSSPDSERVIVFNQGRSLVLLDGNIVPEADNRFDLFKDLLLYRSREQLIERLMELGVDVNTSSLGRLDKDIVYVIGAQYPDESVSQIWVDRESFLPVRWIIKNFRSNMKPDSLEIRYRVWWKVGNTRYPSRIEFYQDDNLVRVNQAIKFEENAAFDETLFDIGYLKSLYPSAAALTGEPGVSEEPSEVEKTIQEFRRLFE